MNASELRDRLAIRPANSCLRRLAWDCDFAEPPALPELCSALLAAGFVDDSRADFLRELRHQSGHSVLVVPRTGRVQLRLHYLTPLLERRATAERFAHDLAGILPPHRAT